MSSGLFKYFRSSSPLHIPFDYFFQLRKDLFFHSLSVVLARCCFLLLLRFIPRTTSSSSLEKEQEKTISGDHKRIFFFSLAVLITSILLCFILSYNQRNTGSRKKKVISIFSSSSRKKVKYANINHIYSEIFLIRTAKQFSMKEISFVRQMQDVLVRFLFSFDQKNRFDRLVLSASYCLFVSISNFV